MILKRANITKKPEKYNVGVVLRLEVFEQEKYNVGVVLRLEVFEQEKYIQWMMAPLKYTIREEVKALLGESSSVISNSRVSFTGRRK